jgi:hypothetical protein
VTLALGALLSACAVHPAPRPLAASRPFIVTFWCAPPLPRLDDARLRDIKAAGFTTIGAPCEGGLEIADNQRLLAAAARYGLRVWVADHRLYAAAGGAADAPALAAAVAATYRDAPALDGYVVADEPTTSQFPALAAVVAALRAADPSRLAYINLLPDYVPPALLEADSYADYLERFAATVQPRLLSVDYYPFGKHKDRSSVFANLSALRDTALRHDLPFLWIALAMPHGPYRNPTEGELAWQAFHALAYGARGISYFTYWTPHADEWNHRDGIVDDGVLTPRYFQVQRLNRQLRAIGDALTGWRSLAVADSRGIVATPLPIGPLAGVDGGDFTIGFFGDGAGGIAALVVNRDYRNGATATLHLRAGAAAPLALVDGRWQRSPSLEWVLEPGGARLLKWE